ncbi:unnamed protein product [Rangifer tarandus platyrhynchus]|uniref:Uncharacterized protein n=2 Tax=Rangifer tarandus platyrhynchus TaxID=3082113 RepID=A0ABN8Y271_RANTA|nr:unnamed protein product [Rangifer tarandus platyrhynchus]
MSRSSCGVKFWGNGRLFRKQKVRFSHPRPSTAGFRRLTVSIARVANAPRVDSLRPLSLFLHLHLTVSFAQSDVLAGAREAPSALAPLTNLWGQSRGGGGRREAARRELRPVSPSSQH